MNFDGFYIFTLHLHFTSSLYIFTLHLHFTSSLRKKTNERRPFLFGACFKCGRQIYTIAAPSCCVCPSYCHLSATLQTMSITVVNLQDNRAVFRIFITLLIFSFDSRSFKFDLKHFYIITSGLLRNNWKSPEGDLWTDITRILIYDSSKRIAHTSKFLCLQNSWRLIEIFKALCINLQTARPSKNRIQYSAPSI